MTQQTTYEFFATCAKGAEKVLAQELSRLAAPRARQLRIRPLSSGVAFFATQSDVYRALLHLFCASRVLLILGRGEAANADGLYAFARSLPWEEHIPSAGTIAVDARGTNDYLRDTRFVAQRVKDAVCDRLLELCGERPSVEKNRPDVRLNVTLRGSRVTVALDLAGEPLHRRGYRMPSAAITAPLRETLAATMLMAGDWGCQDGNREYREGNRGCQEGDSRYLLDPLCGSGTIAIEAALMASGRAPGLLRDYWGFEGWLGHDPALWASLLDAADERAEAASEIFLAKGSLIFASDVDPIAVNVARESARRAGVADCIHFETIDVADLRLSQQQRAMRGLLTTNPPYGERLSSRSQLPILYAALAELRASAPQNLDAVIITPDDRVDAYLNAAPTLRVDTFNGPLETAIRVWRLCWENEEEARDKPHPNSNSNPNPIAHKSPSSDENEDEPRSEDHASNTQFVNRLRKMATHRKKWARHADVSCYRVYDADLPDYAVAIDLYQGAESTADRGRQWLHIAEYAPPSHIDEHKAARRLATALRASREILNVPTGNVYLKQRLHSKGGEQYVGDEAARPTPHLIMEDNLIFEVEFERHLDTGLFLDHRTTRALLRKHAKGLDCLNLFAYTGAASVYMAAGGARGVTTIDLSRTYLDWAQRNMRHNHFVGGQYRFEQADATLWAQAHRHDAEKYGLIFVDPPTFSNSAQMGSRTWDVQRDHAEMLIALSRMLTANGLIIFSCNLRGFAPDVALLGKAKVAIKDITTQTIPPDFERNPKIHHCYQITKLR
jgi:23S rRNA (guanine2445-N2)-methyltransferase / 23S rRNA (guanine2069-N7)-methyltransferase